MIIAEFCQNHCGDWEILKEMIHSSRRAGAWGGKIQTFFADDLSDGFTNQYIRMKRAELSWELHQKFVSECKSVGMVPITTIYKVGYLPKLIEAGFRWIKIGSPQAMNKELICITAATGVSVIMSTGGWELEKLPRITPLACVMHCVSDYPTHPYKANLSRLIRIKRLWNSAIGFSSHIDPLHPKWFEVLGMAMYLGAQYTEVHYTILPRDKTQDGPVSITEDQLAKLSDFEKLDHGEKLDQFPHWGMILPIAPEFDPRIAHYSLRFK